MNIVHMLADSLSMNIFQMPDDSASMNIVHMRTDLISMNIFHMPPGYEIHNQDDQECDDHDDQYPESG